MKALKITLLLLAIFSVAACGEDDDELPVVCTQADWLGTYTGSIDCTSTNPEDVNVTITASGPDAVVIAYQTATITGEYSPIPFDGCNLNASDNTGGISFSLTVTREGDLLRWTETIGDGAIEEICTILATKN